METELSKLQELIDELFEMRKRVAQFDALEAEYKRSEAIKSGTNRVLEMVARGAPLIEVLDVLTRFIEEHADGMLCSILLLDPDGITLRYYAAPTLPKAYISSVDGFSIGPSVRSCGTAAYRKEQVIVEDVASDPLWVGYRELALKYGLRACWSTPILSTSGDVLGTFAMYYGEPRSPSPEHLELIKIATHIAGIAIESRGAEKALEESEERFRSAFDYATVGMALVAPDGCWLKVNRSLCEIVGYSEDELLSTNFQSITHPDDLETDLEFVRQMLAGEIDTYQMEKRYLHKAGQVVWVLLSVSLVRDSQGRPLYFISQIQDITERKRVESSLRDSLTLLSKKSRYESIISTVTRSVHQSINLEEVLQNAVEAMSKNIEGVDNVSIYMVDGQEAVLKAYRGYPDWFIEQVRRIPYPKGFTWKTIIDGKARYVADAEQDTVIGPAGRLLGTKSYAAMPIDSQGNTVGVININSLHKNAFDEEELKLLRIVAKQIEIAINNAQQAEVLRQSEEILKEHLSHLSKKNRYESIISTVTRSVHKSLNLQEVLQNAVEALSKNIDRVSHVSIFLVEGEEAVLKSHVGFPGWFIERVKRIPYPKGAIWKTIIEGITLYCPDVDSDVVIGPAGKQLGIKSYLCTPINFEDKVVGALNINSLEKCAFDEEELKLLQIVAQQIETAINNARIVEAHRQSEERYHTLFDQAPVGVYIFDRDLTITHCNKRMAEILSSSPEKIVGISIRKLRNQCVLPLMERVLGGQNASYEGFYEATSSFAKLWVSIRLSPLRDAGGKVIGGMAVVEDVTERKRMEEEILKAQKLESVGILAGGIAHDFNNLLSAILGNISLTKLYTNPDDKSHKRLTEAEKACIRASDLTQQLLTFSKGGAPVKKLLSSLGDLIKDTANFAVSGSNVRCEFHIAEDLWSVEVDEGQVSQVINNLVINAQQAMPEGGLVKVSVDNVQIDKEASIPLREGRYVKVSVEDRGIGIPREHLSKIFDPYFTTKYRGSGLGLATVYSIIKKHDGYVDVESEVGVGTKFFLYIPAAETKPEKEAEEKMILGGKGKILVMDDEEAVRVTLGEMLRYLGYEVECAGDGREAIDLYIKAKRTNRPFDLVIMDLTIPGGMGGKEAMEELSKLDSGVRAIVSSGYSNDSGMSEFVKYGFRGFVAKPYRIEELSRIVREAINGG